MKQIYSLILVIVLFFVSQSVFGNHIEQPNFPRLPNHETDFSQKVGGFACGDLYIFLFFIPQTDNEQYWKFYYLGDKFTQHKPIVVMHVDEAKDFVRAWVDNNRDGHFDERFDDGELVFEKYKSPCQIVAQGV